MGRADARSSWISTAGRMPALLVNNFDWMRRLQLSRFPARRRQALSRERDARQGLGQSRLGRGETRRQRASATPNSATCCCRRTTLSTSADKYGCELQVGGSDQWGNITAGIDLARRMRGAQLYGITWPLLTKSDGTKMGKTENGAVWLAAERTSPYQFYQYWINVDDADAGNACGFSPNYRTKKSNSSRSPARIDPDKRESQRRLAEELTRIVHGEAGLPTAQKATEIFFGAEIADLNDAQLAEIFADVPSKTLSRCDGLATAASPSSTPWSKPASPKAKAKPAARSSKAAPTSTTAASKKSTPHSPPSIWRAKR